MHHYQTLITWTGNRGQGTADYRGYGREHTLFVDGKEMLHCSSDPAFLGDRSRYNPEELFLAAVSSCHMLWYLHLCADAGIIVSAYADSAQGHMQESGEGGGRFTEITLYPEVKITSMEQTELAIQLHEEANKRCFIANSLNIPVACLAKVVIEGI